MVTIKDISKRCNVSPATVSKALNGYEDISKETIELVKRTAQEMHYMPNAAARQLKTNISHNIGDIQSDLDREFFGSKAGGKVLVIKRVRIANGVPVTIEENHLFPEMISLKDENLEGSLYELFMNKYHMIPANKGRRSVKIVFADEEVAELLDLSIGTPVITGEMCVFDVNGEPIHTVRDWVRGDNDRFITWYT